jgi:hypothetical protein
MKEFIGVSIIFIAGFIFGLWCYGGSLSKSGYKQGQIDCLNGKIKYEKESVVDTTVTFKPVK